jgi:hypothetical protein
MEPREPSEEHERADPRRVVQVADTRAILVEDPGLAFELVELKKN